MANRLGIQLIGADEIVSRLGALPAQVERAMKRTVASAVRIGATEIRRGASAAHGIPQKALKARRRVAIRTGEGLVWAGYNDIYVGFLGAPRKVPGGVKVAGKIYPGAFIITSKKGAPAIVQRMSRSRLAGVGEPLDKMPQAAESARGKLISRLPAIFERELNYEVNVRGR
jgi:hypothetical protein